MKDSTNILVSFTNYRYEQDRCYLLKYIRVAFYSLILLMIISYRLVAQSNSSSSNNPEIIKLDSITFKADKRIPFDREFILEMKVPEDIDIQNIFLYNVEIKRDGASKVIRKLEDPDNSGNISPKYILGSKLSGTSLKIFVDPLEPNKNFDIELVQKFSGKNLNALIKVLYLIHRGGIINAASEFTANLDPDIIEQPTPSIIQKKYYSGTFMYVNFFHAFRASPFLTAIDHTTTLLPNFAAINAIPYQYLYAQSTANAIDNAELGSLFSIPDVGAYKKILSGINKISIEKKQDVGDFEIEARLKNIKESLIIVSKLKVLSQSLLLNNGVNPVFISFAGKISGLESALIKSSSIIALNYKKLVATIKADSHFMYGKLLIVSSNMETIQTGAGYNLIPEIGIANTFPTGHDGMKYIPRIYLGVNINFRPIDKNLKFQNVPREAIFWYRTSLTLGITTKPVQNKDFGDFFNNTSLLVGINYRFARGIRVSAGPILYRQKNYNPIVEKQILAMAPFLALSFDVDITQAIDKLIGKLF